MGGGSSGGGFESAGPPGALGRKTAGVEKAILELQVRHEDPESANLEARKAAPHYICLCPWSLFRVCGDSVFLRDALSFIGWHLLYSWVHQWGE